MANIRENKKGSKTISYRFIAYLGKDAQGKQIRRYTTWTLPDGLTPSKAFKAAERAADVWEQDVKAEFQKEQAAKQCGLSYSLPPEKRKDDFVSFVTETWFALYICNGDRKQSTVHYYESMIQEIVAYFRGAILQDISPIHIQHFLQHLRKEHEHRTGKPISPKYLHHYYSTLKNIFGYAEKNDLIAKNPMNHVDPPKTVKKPVDALTPEQASMFFKHLENCSLDFRCMLHLLLVTGVRRSELLGLKWRDIDEKRSILRIERGVTYTPQTGILVSTPKTVTSIRSIPLTPSTLRLLQQLKSKVRTEYPHTILKEAFLFPSEKDIFFPRDPNAFARRVRRFMHRSNLPDFSCHDLRHSAATLLVSSGADIKSIQQILGHSSADVTLNFYVRSDISQMKSATDKFAAAFGL